MATRKSTKTAQVASKKKPAKPKVGLRKNILTLTPEVLYAAHHAVGEYPDLKIKGSGPTRTSSIDMNDVSILVVKALLTYDDVPAKVKEELKKFLAQSPEELLKKHISTVHEAYAALRFIMHSPNPVLEFELNGVWYPVPVTVRMYKGWFFSEVSLRLNAQVHDQSVDREWYIGDSDFLNTSGVAVQRTLAELLQELGLRFTNKEHLKNFRDKLTRAEQMTVRTGLVVDVEKPVLVEADLGWKTILVPYSLGMKGSPKPLIIEGELEADREVDFDRSEKIYTLPFIRAFSAKLKKYVYVDVDDVKEHVYRAGVRDLLVLPDGMRRALDAVFDTPPDQVFGDLFDGRHGGVVILAAGGPGVGKTLTAEVYAESMKRPLYVMEMGELGTSLAVVEQNLQKIFDRARRWNAVLLLDEADIFLSRRQDSDLERGAIVATFLRLLDYYEGTFFLTTNREEVIDDAFRSRATLRLAYPDLVEESRTRVWSQLLRRAELEFEGNISELAKENVNGRNIRNAIRVLKMFHPKAAIIGMKEIHEALQYISRPTQNQQH